MDREIFSEDFLKRLSNAIKEPILTICAPASEPLTEAKLTEALSILNKTPIPVICFHPLVPRDSVLEGETIDCLLSCKGREKGYLLPIEHRDAVREAFSGPFGDFIERELGIGIEGRAEQDEKISE